MTTLDSDRHAMTGWQKVAAEAFAKGMSEGNRWTSSIGFVPRPAQFSEPVPGFILPPVPFSNWFGWEKTVLLCNHRQFTSMADFTIQSANFWSPGLGMQLGQAWCRCGPPTEWRSC